MENVLISVIVPVFKIEEKLLRNCLESLMAQTEEAAEFIVVDDGSPDDCGEIIDAYAPLDKRFVIVHTKNLGVSNARNEGLKRAKGDYIAFVDGDDYIEKDMCEKTVQAMRTVGTDILFFMHQSTVEKMIAPHDESITLLSVEMLRNLTIGVISQENPLGGVWAGPPWGKVYKKSIIEENELSFVLGLRKSQDRVFVFDYLSHAKSAALYKYIGYHYVVNENSVCQKYNRNIVSILEMAGAEFEKRVARLEKNHEYVQALDTMYMIFFCEYMLLNLFNHDNTASFCVRYSEMKKILKIEKYRRAIKNGNINVISRKRRLMILALRHHLYLTGALFATILF